MRSSPQVLRGDGPSGVGIPLLNLPTVSIIISHSSIFLNPNYCLIDSGNAAFSTLHGMCRNWLQLSQFFRTLLFSGVSSAVEHINSIEHCFNFDR